MIVNVYVPLVLSVLFGLTAPAIARRLPPAVAAWALSLGGLLAAGAWFGALGLLAFTLVGQDPTLASDGHWSDTALRHFDPVATPVAAAALLLLVVSAVRLTIAVPRHTKSVLRAHRLASALPAAGGELVVLDDAGVLACSVPGRPGRIVVSSGMLKVLEAGGRRAVLAHERSHLAHRHHLHRLAAGLAACSNPFLRGLPGASALATERWADEDAAAQCRRAVVADAVSEVSRRRGVGWQAHSAAVLAVGAEHLTERIAALRAPAPILRPWPLLVLAVMLVVAVLAGVDAVGDTAHLFEFAHSVQHLHRS